MPDEVDPTAAPEVRQAVAGQKIRVAGNVVHTLAPGETLVELPGVDVLYRVAGTPTPTPVPPPGLPPLARNVAPAGVRPSFGRQEMSGGPFVLRDEHWEGYGTNLSFEHVAGLTASNLRSLRAWRPERTPTDARTYMGQGLYLDDVRGPARVKGYFGGWNGWQSGRPVADRTQYRHAVYQNFGCRDFVLEDFILSGQPACGLQSRGGATLRNGVILDCGIGVLASMGTLTLENVTIYGGNYYWTKDQHGEAWTGMVAAAAYWPLVLNNVWIVGRPNQAVGDATVGASGIVRKYPGPAIQLNVQKPDPAHPEWRPPPAGTRLVTVGPGCVVAGWPLNPMSPTTFGGSGMTPAAAAELAKVRVTSSPVAFDYGPLLGQVERNEIGIADAVGRLTAGIRAGVA